MRERGRRTPFSPSAPVTLDISDLVFKEIATMHPEILDVMIPEYLTYTTAGLWMKIASLKSFSQQPMDSERTHFIRERKERKLRFSTSYSHAASTARQCTNAL